MRKLVKADIRRILRKKVLYIFTILICIIIFCVPDNEDPSDQVNLCHKIVDLAGPFLILIPVYLTVYADELKAGTMQGVIGRGMSRMRLVASKLIDCMILMGFMYLFMVIAFYINNLIGGLELTRKQNLMIFIYALFKWIRVSGLMSIAGIMIFASWNPSIGLITAILLTFAGGILRDIQEKIHVEVYDISLTGLIEDAYNDAMIGDFPWKLILAVIIYFGGALFITSKVFCRKELDL